MVGSWNCEKNGKTSQNHGILILLSEDISNSMIFYQVINIFSTSRFLATKEVLKIHDFGMPKNYNHLGLISKLPSLKS